MIIIGAGASGLIASIFASKAGQRVTLLEQNNKIAKKILVSGNGQCNIGNRFISHNRFYSENSPFIEAVLEGYGVEVIESFFASIGVELIQKKEGKLFPLSLQASSVVSLLEYEALRLGVEIVTECRVDSVSKIKNSFVLETSKGQRKADKLLITTGSLASPQLGGNDSGYRFAQGLGHSLIPPSPALVQLCSNEPWVKSVSGVKIAGVAKLYANGNYITEKKGDLLFTAYGISGLAILDLSAEVGRRIALYEYCELSLDLMPQWSKEQLTQILLKRLSPNSQKPLELWLNGIIHQKLIAIILTQSRCKVKSENELNRKEIIKLVYAMKNLKLSIDETRGWAGAEVATGGVNTLEINPKTMQSKLIPNLFFAGEVLDVDGDRGGFNFHFAWVSGMRMGKSLA